MGSSPSLFLFLQHSVLRLHKMKMNSETTVLEPPLLPTIDQLIDLEIRVTGEIEELKNEIEAAIPEIEAVSPESSVGDLSRNSIVHIYEMAVDAQNRREARLVKLEPALERMDSGNYGECEACHEGISWSRLDARPEARFCAQCVLEEA